MKVKDIKPTLEKKKGYFSDLQSLEKELRNNDQLRKKLNELCETENLLQSITEARMSFYDNEVLKLEWAIDNAEIEVER